MQQGEQGKNQASDKAAESSDSATNNDASLEAEQESAAAMDADVPQPPQADETTEGQPS